jgi:hypothetical protein
MLTPHDKIRRGGNDTIQIIITRACDIFTCTNCTQLLPFRSDALHMSTECFRNALRSLADWPGIVGIFGGNPCCHPRFAELMKILMEEIPVQRHRGIWTNNLLKHGALVREVFYPHGRFNLNAHADPAAAADIERWLPGKLIPKTDRDPAWHAAMLADYRDFGMSEEQWIAAREACDINQKWSAAIAERDGQPYAYFCEVAASLDGVRGENHGIPANPGWWQSRMDTYKHQVRECCDRGCGVPLRFRGHLDRAATYDVSASWQGVLTPPRGDIHINMIQPHASHCQDAADYMKRWSQ